jgi:hypothetical protein
MAIDCNGTQVDAAAALDFPHGSASLAGSWKVQVEKNKKI